MNNNEQAALNDLWRIPFVVPTVGQLKQLIALATGVNADDLMVVDTLGQWMYELPDYVTPPDNLFVCLKPHRQYV